MAEIVFALGASHGPLLSTPPEEWDGRAEVDRNNRELAFRDGTFTFEELLRVRDVQGFREQNSIKVRRDRYDDCRRHLDELAVRAEVQSPDIVVVIGDDQGEWFRSDIQPAFAIFHGTEVNNRKLTAEELDVRNRNGTAWAARVYHPPEDEHYPCSRELAEVMVQDAVADGFDVTTCAEQPRDGNQLRRLGHAYGFIYRRILQSRPVPMVPVMINTYFPPNQPTVSRCLEFGRSLGRAIRNWKNDAKVGIAASGGVSHFVVDEDFDQRMLRALQDRDYETMCREPESHFRSGTSETKNWIVVAGMLAGSGLEMDLIGYVPCYRTEAGTGSGMAFASWQ